MSRESSDAHPRLCGVVVAAGLSTRMGGFPKPLLHVDGERFVERILHTLADGGVTDRVVVLGYEHEAVRERADLDDARVLVNEAYREGMLSSVQRGVAATPSDADGFLLWPVDYPFAPASVLDALHEAFDADADTDEDEHADVIQPTVDGERGHPVVFAASTFDALRSAPEDEGARAVVYADETTVREVPVDDPRILVDVDTPEEYWQAVKRYG